MRERILITGPGGRVGPHLLPYLRAHFDLRLLDSRPLPVDPEDEFVQADIRDLDALKPACAGIQAIVHLAAIPDEDDFYTKLLPMNLQGAYTIFEAARQSGVPKIIFASTCQTILNYGEGTWVTPDMPVRPSSIYGCTKVFGEALGRHYSDRHGLSVICLRIAWFQPYHSEPLRRDGKMASHWCSPGDLAQLIIKSLQSQVPFAIFFGVSNNTGRFWDISNAQQLVGYDPQDDAARLR